MKNSRIELREYNIGIGKFGYASHQFWTRHNANGEIVGELHGLCTNGKGKPNMFSIPGTHPPLEAVSYPLKTQKVKTAKEIVDGGLSGGYKVKQDSMIMLRGAEEEIDLRWQSALEASKKLSEQQVKYELFPDLNDPNVGNCNSVARTLGEVMGFDPQNISGRRLPGQEKNLLPPDRFPDLYKQWPEDNSSDHEVHLMAESDSSLDTCCTIS